MESAMQIVQIIFYSVAILFMICFIFIGIWSFIIFLKMAKTLRIQTYLLEKINKSILTLKKINKDELPSNSDFLIEDLISSNDNILKLNDNIE